VKLVVSQPKRRTDRLRVFGKRVLRRIYGSKRKEEAG
jgi:hypothetical protein